MRRSRSQTGFTSAVAWRPVLKTPDIGGMGTAPGVGVGKRKEKEVEEEEEKRKKEEERKLSELQGDGRQWSQIGVFVKQLKNLCIHLLPLRRRNVSNPSGSSLHLLPSCFTGEHLGQH